MKVTKNSGLQPALDWLEANGEDEANFIENEESEKDSKKAKTCLMCNGCKKKFTTLERAEMHAARTSHDDFIESVYEEVELEEQGETEPVPVLTEEEKVARLEELRAKLALKRAAREKEEKAAESLRKASSRELEQIKREMQAKEMKKLAEERRMEKIADKKRREEILKQIEEDRVNKAKQIEAEKAKNRLSGVNAVNDEILESAVMTDAPVASISSSNINSARIQIRLPPQHNKLPLKLTFDSPSTQTLKDLKDRIKVECPSLGSADGLMQTFPTRLFGEAEDQCTLSELGLAPSASLILK